VGGDTAVTKELVDI